MFGLSYETLATIGSLIFLTITQIILIKNGKTDQALKVEQKKERLCQKLTNKRNKNIKKAEELNEEIKKLKE